MSKLVVVTGGGGFVGRHLVAALHARGDRVRTIDLRFPSDLPGEHVRADITSADAMRSYLALNELTALPHDAREFPDFFEARRVALASRVRRKLASGVADTQTEETAAEEYDSTELDAALDE